MDVLLPSEKSFDCANEFARGLESKKTRKKVQTHLWGDFMRTQLRTQLLDFLEANPTASRTQVKIRIPRARMLLGVYDRAWLEMHLPPFNFGGPLRYIGLSLKKTYMRRTPKGVRRGQREQSNLGRIGWGWKYLDLSNPEEAAADFNHNMLVDWANSPHNESIDAFEREAAALGAALYQTSSKKPLGALLAMLGRRLGIKESLQLHVFACAYYLGYIQLSHSEELGLSRPLNLAPPARRFGGAYVRR